MYTVYQSNVMVGQIMLDWTDSFNSAWISFVNASKYNDKGQTTYMVVGEENE